MIFLSAGHFHGDPGAIGVGGLKEADLTIDLRDRIAAELDNIGGKYTLDKDSETLSQYMARIKPGSGSVVCELHFNSATTLASGIEVLIADDAGMPSRRLAQDLVNVGVSAMGIFNRGVKTEKQSHRGRLGILHTNAGISVLPEICFINNPKDLEKYQQYKTVLALRYAWTLKKYDEMFS